ncbi:MAG TPA: hypothetical protein VLY23_09855 [Candidatus Acidoferrum sp.]|nr:hypothetical protein [Candidatus Acidoferrum sp.]
MRRGVCPNHGVVSPFYQAGSPLAGAAAMGTLAHNLSKGDPLITLLFAGVGWWLGSQTANHCPQCGALLEFVGDINPLFGQVGDSET